MATTIHPYHHGLVNKGLNGQLNRRKQYITPTIRSFYAIL